MIMSGKEAESRNDSDADGRSLEMEQRSHCFFFAFWPANGMCAQSDSPGQHRLKFITNFTSATL